MGFLMIFVYLYRYEFGGTPLPFASDKTFDTLFPVPGAAAPVMTVTKAAFDATPAQALRRTYAPSAVPRCPHCGGRRVFECQLVPNLINVLKRSEEGEDAAKRSKQTDEERRAEVMKALKGESGAGMDWGTCMIFSCEKDCSEGDKTWREELVLVQWDI